MLVRRISVRSGGRLVQPNRTRARSLNGGSVTFDPFKEKLLESSPPSGRFDLYLDAEVTQALKESVGEPGLVALDEVLVAEVAESDAIAHM